MPRIDPDIEAIIPLLPREDLTDPMADRRNAAERVASRQAIDTGDMRIEDRTVPSSPDVAVRIYRPRDFHGAVIWLHGGGFVMGDLDSEHPWAARIAQLSGAAVISVDYRLAPEHRFPAQLHDAYAVLTWTGEHASELGIDPDRIAIGGHSAGAGLAAAVALRARDEQGPPICFQLLNEPGLDDRQQTWSQRTFTDTPWSYRDKVTAAWHHYLGPEPANEYAAPARATDLTGLPAAYIATAEFDPVRDEGIDYAVRMLRAGVQVELHQFSGTFHGSQVVSTAEVSQRQIAGLAAALRRAVAVPAQIATRSTLTSPERSSSELTETISLTVR